MAGEAFRRARGFLAKRRAWVILAHATGGVAGALLVGWMILLVLFVDLLLNGVNYQPVGADADFARQLVAEARELENPDFHNAGMLSVVVASRDRFMGPAFEHLYRRHDWFRRSDTYLALLLSAVLIVGALRVFLLYLHRVAVAEATAGAQFDLQRAVFQHRLKRGSPIFGDERNLSIAGLLKRAIPETRDGLEAWLESPARDLVKIILLLALVITLNPLLGMTFILLACLLWIVGSWTVARLVRRRRELADNATHQLERVIGLSGTLRLIKGYAADLFFGARIEDHLAAHYRDTRRRLLYEARFAPFRQFAGLVLAIVVLALGAQNVLTGKFALSEAVGVCACLLGLPLPLNSLYRCWQAVRSGGRAARQVFDFLDQDVGREPAEGAAFLPPLKTFIELEKVSYRANGRALVDDLSIRIHAGQRIAVVGRNEQEKRAFVSLFARFIEPTSGRVRFDGVDLRDVTLDSLRSQVCMVLESDLLFPDTVANNIGLGDPGFSQSRIVEAAKMAHAHQFVSRLPHGYQCLIGPEGFPLKMGESFRIAMARAVLRDPPVLIVEEPREALDEDTKAALGDTFARFFPGRTVLILPHRLSTLRACEQIFVIDQGKLVACGSHRELLETSELYRHLQYTEFYAPSTFSS